MAYGTTKEIMQNLQEEIEKQEKIIQKLTVELEKKDEQIKSLSNEIRHKDVIIADQRDILKLYNGRYIK